MLIFIVIIINIIVIIAIVVVFLDRPMPLCTTQCWCLINICSCGGGEWWIIHHDKLPLAGAQDSWLLKELSDIITTSSRKNINVEGAYYRKKVILFLWRFCCQKWSLLKSWIDSGTKNPFFVYLQVLSIELKAALVSFLFPNTLLHTISKTWQRTIRKRKD